MSKDINLLYSKKQLSQNELAGKVRLLRWISLGGLFSVGIVSIILFLLLISSPYPSLKKNEDELTQSLSQSHEKILKQTLLSNRLKDISLITSKRSHYGDDLAAIRSLLSEKAEVTDFSVEKKEAIMTISSDNLSDLDDGLEKLKDSVKSKKLISQVYLISLETQQDVTGEAKSFQAILTLTLL